MVARTALVCVCALLVTVAAGTKSSYDLVPFRVAAAMAMSGHWSGLYPLRTATSLRDLPSQYRETAAAAAPSDGTFAFRSETLVAFISPPPAAFLLAPFAGMSAPTALTAVRIAMVLPLCLALLVAGECAGRWSGEARAHWSLVCVAAAPLLLYPVWIGQTSVLIGIASVLSLLPSTVGRDVAGGVALSLLVLTKATPVAVVVGLWLIGRRRMAGLAFAISASAVVCAMPFTGPEAWRYFFDFSRQLGRSIIPVWANLSIAAQLIRTVHGLSGDSFYLLTDIEWTLVSATTTGLLILAARSAFRPFAPGARQVAAVWVFWLVALPMFWVYYAVALIPIFGSAAIRQRRIGLVLAAAFSGVLIARTLGVGSLPVGTFATVVWLVSAGWLLSDAAWTRRSMSTTE